LYEVTTTITKTRRIQQKPQKNPTKKSLDRPEKKDPSEKEKRKIKGK